MNGVFITGTDTGVGKTVISAALLCVLKSAGVDAVYMKPVQTGCRQKSGKLVAPDFGLVCSLAGVCPPESERKFMTPYRFRRACSPHLAAGLEKRNFRFSKIMKSFTELKRRHDFVIVEGAGGILTPLSWEHSILDVMKSLSLPVVLVARPGLGTLNHTLLTLHELRRAKLRILGVVLNYAANKVKGIIETSNKEAIERLGRVPVLAEFPFIAGLRHNARSRDKFKKAAREMFMANSCSLRPKWLSFPRKRESIPMRFAIGTIFPGRRSLADPSRLGQAGRHGNDKKHISNKKIYA